MKNKSIVMFMIFVFVICFEHTNAQEPLTRDSSNCMNYDSVSNNTFTMNEIKHFREYIRNYVIMRKEGIDTIEQMVLVPDEETAISIAKIIFQKHSNNLFRVYKQFIAEKVDNLFWRVAGVFPKNYNGGMLMLEINIYNGQIYYINPGK